MLDIKFIRENKEIVAAAIAKKRGSVDIEELIAADDERIAALNAYETIRAEQNQISNLIGIEKDANKRAQMITEMQVLKEDVKKREEEMKVVMEKWQALMLKVPNLPSLDTPEGPDDTANKVIREWGTKPQFSFKPKEHFEIGEELGIIDTKTAAEVASSRFAYLKGDLVLMQFALIQMCFEILTNEQTLQEIANKINSPVKVASFIPVIPPVFVRPVVQVKMARYMGAENHYVFPNDDLMLVGSAEHTLGSQHINQTFTEADLPIRYAGYSTAFRREAGTYGKDTNGILRQHQFDKLEMEVFSLPETSLSEQDFLVAIQEHVLQTLNLPYHVVSVCTGDMGFPDYRQMDIETWMPGQDTYRETHSADLTSGFQARRLNTRVKRADGKIEPVHMNDATVVAIGRTLIAIIENYQNEDGSIRIPDALQKYMGGKTLITKK